MIKYKNGHFFKENFYKKALDLYELGKKEFFGYSPLEIIEMANLIYEDTLEDDNAVQKVSFNRVISQINLDLGLTLPTIIEDSGMNVKYPNYKFYLPYLKDFTYNGTIHTMDLDTDYIPTTFQTYIKILNVNILRLEDEEQNPLPAFGRLRFVLEGGNLVKETDDTRPATFYFDLRIGLNSDGTITTYGNALLDESFINLGTIQIVDNVDTTGIKFGYGTGDDDTEDGVGGLNFYIQLPQVIGSYAYPLVVKEVNIEVNNLMYNFDDFQLITKDNGIDTNFAVTELPILNLTWNLPIDFINGLVIPKLHSLINIKEGDYETQTSPELQYLRARSDFLNRLHDLIPNIYIDKTTLDKIYKSNRNKKSGFNPFSSALRW